MMNILPVFLLAVGALGQPQETVFSYIKNLQLCMQWGSNIFVKHLVEEKLAQKLQVWLDAWRSSGYTIQAKPLEIKVVKQRMWKDRAEVVTKERWTYRYIYLKTGEEALSPQLIDYEILYKLRKVNDGWKISAIKILKEVKYGCDRNCE